MALPGIVADLHQSAVTPTAVLFDLDGTITDSAPAITMAIAQTLESFGQPAMSDEELTSFIGPPIRVGFAQFASAPEAVLDAMVAEFRRCYATTMCDVPLYDGITDLLEALTRKRVPLGVATSKPRSIAVSIIEHVGIASSFAVVCGAPNDHATSSKAGIIGEALSGLRQAGADITDVIMVGDRHHDIEGARANSINAVLAGWGYGHLGEEGGSPRCANVAALAPLLGIGMHRPQVD